MKTLLGAVALMMAGTALAHAEGELFLYNWGNYTSPDMIKKFEDKYQVKVTITDFDSNDTALAKVEAGASGFDLVVPSAGFVRSSTCPSCRTTRTSPPNGWMSPGIRAGNGAFRGSGDRRACRSTSRTMPVTSTPATSS